MQSEETKKARILEYSIKKFMSVGYQQVTMDEIAHGVGMGKGTIYKLYPSKEDLLFNAIDFFAKQLEISIKQLLDDEKMTDIEKLKGFLKAVSQKLLQIKPELLISVERFAPKAYEKLEKMRQRIIMTNLVKLLEDGKKNGTYNSEMDMQFVAQVLIGAIKHITETQVLSSFHYSIDEIFRQLTTIIFKGCLTNEKRNLIV